MRSTHAVAGLLALSPLLQPSPADSQPGRAPVARVLVESTDRRPTEVGAVAPGGRLRVAFPGPQLGASVTATTPTVIEVYGEPAELRIASSPARPVRVRVVSGPAGRVHRTHEGWSFLFRRTERGYVPAVQALRVPPR